jgi:hypothetical protein
MALRKILASLLTDGSVNGTVITDGSIAAVDLSASAITDKLGYTPVSPTDLSEGLADKQDTIGSELNVTSVKGVSGNKLQLLSGDSNFGVSLQNISGVDLLAVDAVGRVTMPYQPAFSAYDTRGYVKVSTSDLLCNTTNFNIGGHYNTSNGRFTAPISGKYIFTCNIQSADTFVSGDPYISATPRINNSGIGIAEFVISVTSTSDHRTLSPTIIVNMNSGDYFTWYCGRGYRSGGQISMSGSLIS